MRYCITRTAVKAEVVPDDTVQVLPLFDDERGCEKFAQRVLSFRPGASRDRTEPGSDEVLYVLAGSGTATIADRRQKLEPGIGLFVGRGTPWSIEADDEVELVAVLVRDPEPAEDCSYAVVDLDREERRSATAARQFTLGVTPEVGCASVTQFIGYVPPGRAPDHFHRYDEVLYILEGEGILHIGGEEAEVGPGSCVHLPATLVHSLENSGSDELRLLGVFRPAGSPAEAYYPDGTPATYPGSDDNGES